MTLLYNAKNNPRVIVIQKLYEKYFNKNETLTFPKHRFKKFIKDVVKGTIEREDVISDLFSEYISPQVLEEDWDVEGLQRTLKTEYATDLPIQNSRNPVPPPTSLLHVFLE